MARYRDSVPTILLIAAMAVSAAVLLYFTSRLTFLIDDWEFLLAAGVSPDVFLDPHDEHISVVPVPVYKAIQAGMRMKSLLPYGVVSTAAFYRGLAAIHLPPRALGAWLALAGVLPILFFGSAARTC